MVNNRGDMIGLGDIDTDKNHKKHLFLGWNVQPQDSAHVTFLEMKTRRLIQLMNI